MAEYSNPDEESVSAMLRDLSEQSDRAIAERAARLPDEQSAINAMFDAYQRLVELGWRNPIYCPKDGEMFKIIEPGSTGIHDCFYQGEWPNGTWWNVWEGDMAPTRPVLFKPITP